MIGKFPVVTFDTSAHNRLVEGNPVSESVFAALKSGLFFRFAALSLEELEACPNSAARTALFACCRRLQAGPTECIAPQNELIRVMVVSHFQNPAAFNWRTVDVRCRDYEDALRTGRFVGDDALSAEQRKDLIRRAKEYKGMFISLRSQIENTFKVHGEQPPLTFRQAIARLQDGGSRLIWGMGKLLYDRGAGTDASESTVKDFMCRCPPFRALIYGMLVSWYDLAVRNRHTGEKLQAGCIDMFMSIYLPYCDIFVTAEKKGQQEKCLREVVAVAGLETEILSFDAFCDSFLVSA